MHDRRTLGALLMAGILSNNGCSQPGGPGEAAREADWPVAEKRPREFVEHGRTRVDDYYWLRDDERSDPQVLAYLSAENEYTERVLAHTTDFQGQLYKELVGRIKQDDSTVPVRLDDYLYYLRYEQGEEHETYMRRGVDAKGSDEVILDVNTLAKPHDYYEIGAVAISPDHRLLAYAEDSVSRGEYVIRIKSLETGELYPEAISMTSDSLAWHNDNRHLYYIKLQEDTLIPYRVYRHELGTDPTDDQLLYEEADSTFSLTLEKSRSRDWVILESRQTLSTEVQLLNANEPDAEFTVFHPREPDHEYHIDIKGDVAYVRSNWEAENFRLMTTPLAVSRDKSKWIEVIPNRSVVFLNDFTVFEDYLVAEERQGGNLILRVIPFGEAEEHVIEADEDAFTAEIDDNPNLSTSVLRYSYTSLATPEIIYDYDMATGKRVLRKQQEVGGGFERSHYLTRRVYAPARDGASIPVTLLFRHNIDNDGTNPLFILGYGSYGISYDPEFKSDRLSLVDRGFVFALAHIRGGQELGRQWYENGKLLHKKNTFTDFIDVTEYLIEEGWGDPNKVVATGRSAGGLLMGAVVNMRPDLYRIMVTEVPFVDVITTMYDESIPLTTFEFDEWGNPKDPEFYDYMLSYSPYDQIQAQDYPNIMVSTGLWDPAVQYWEPAKWVAKMRSLKSDDNRLLFYTDMEAGHRGASGRFERLKDRAREYAFIFDILNIEG